MAVIIQSISTTVMNLLIHLFLKNSYEIKYNNKAIYISSFIISTIVYIAFNRFSAYFNIPIANFFFTILYVVSISCLLYKAPIRKILIYSFFLVLFLTFCDIFTVLIWTIIKGKALSAVLSNDLYVSISCLTNMFLMITLYICFSSILSKESLFIVKIRQTIIIVLFLFFELFVEFSFSERVKNRSDGIITMLIIIGFMLLNICVAYFIKEISSAYKSKYDFDIMKKQSEMQLAHFQDIDSKYEKSRRIIHDMKKHMDVITALNNSNKRESIDYAISVEKEMESVFRTFQCSNKMLAIIMSQKINEAESYGIEIITKVEDITLDYISDIDLTSIFANLWDNSIEACKKIDGEKTIEVVIGKVNEFCMISFDNNYNGEVKSHNNRILSSKPMHNGMGLSIIKHTVNKYKGYINTKYDDRQFLVKIVLPLK